MAEITVTLETEARALRLLADVRRVLADTVVEAPYGARRRRLAMQLWGQIERAFPELRPEDWVARESRT